MIFNFTLNFACVWGGVNVRIGMHIFEIEVRIRLEI